MKNKEQVLSEEAKFELELYQALKTYGFIFPTSVNDVDRFEGLYGKTEIDLPVKLRTPDGFFNHEEKNDDAIIDFQSPISMAALVSKGESVDLSFLSTNDGISQTSPKSKKKRNKK